MLSFWLRHELKESLFPVCPSGKKCHHGLSIFIPISGLSKVCLRSGSGLSQSGLFQVWFRLSTNIDTIAYNIAGNNAVNKVDISNSSSSRGADSTTGTTWPALYSQALAPGPVQMSVQNSSHVSRQVVEPPPW